MSVSSQWKMYYYGEIPLNDFDNAWKTIEMYIHMLAITIGIYFIIYI